MKAYPARFDVSWKTLLAGSGASLALHVSALLLVSLALRGCQKASSGNAGGEPFRDVGLFVVDGVDGGAGDSGSAPGKGDDSASNEAVDPVAESPAATTHSPKSTDRVPEEPPDVSSLLDPSESVSSQNGNSSSTLPQLIGPGDPIGRIQSSRTDPRTSLLNPSEAGGKARVGGTGGPGETTFMDIAGVGKSIVYVIDTSSSMHGSRLKIAQGQLKASLRLLQPNQKFAVIFYNQHRDRLTLLRQLRPEMYFATDINKRLAAEEIDRVVAGNGTEHKPAILEALSLKPDVLYLLTDGDVPELYSDDLAEIRRASSGTTIHVIKFGDGTLTTRATSWLELLAGQSGGEFREMRAE